MRDAVLAVGLVTLSLTLPLNAQTGGTCDKTKAPCIDAPYPTDTKITGKFLQAGQKLDPRSALKVLITNQPPSLAQINDDGTFAARNVHALHAGDVVQIDETSPNSVSPLIGPVTVPEVEGRTQVKAIAGIEQSQSASSNRVGKLYINLGLEEQLTRTTGSRDFRFFIDSSLTSIPQQTGFAISSANVAALAQNIKLNELVQSVETLTGFEVLSFFPGRLSVHPLFAAGFITPVNPTETVQLFQSTPNALKVLKVDSATSSAAILNCPPTSTGGTAVSSGGTPITGCPYLALTSPDRTRFYGQWYFGVRLKMRGTDTSSYPGYFDITFGQNAADIPASSSGPCLCGFVWRPAVFFPVSVIPGLSIFGDAVLQLKRGDTQTPLFLNAAPSSVAPADPDVIVISQISKRDYYHIGVGLEFIELYKFLTMLRKK